MPTTSPPVKLPRLLGLSEVAAYFGVSRQLAQKWTSRRDGLYPFPAPVAGPGHPKNPLSMGNLWTEAQVREWAKASGRKKGQGPLPAGLDVRTVKKPARKAPAKPRRRAA